MNFCGVFLCFLLMTSNFQQTGTAKILFVFANVWSHWVQPINVAKQLQTMYGHNVTFHMSENFLARLNKYGFTEENVIFRDDRRAEKMAEYIIQKMVCSHSTRLQRILDMHAMVNIARNTSKVGCRRLLLDDKLIDAFRAVGFDLLVIDFLQAFNGCYEVLAYKLGIPFVNLGTAYHMTTLGIPFFPAITPSIPFFSGSIMSFGERFANFLMTIYLIIFPMETVDDGLVKEAVAEKPFIRVRELMTQSRMYLINQDPILHFPKPSMPHVQFVGGMSVSEGAPLPVYFQKFMDSAPSGVIIVSFGSIAKTAIQSQVEHLIRTCLEMKKYKFVISYGNQEKISENILLSPWIPQNDLLAHSNTKLFVTHCGNNGMYEALFHGIPMIGLSLFGDQHGNCKRMEAKGFGRCLDICNFQETDFINTVEEVINSDNNIRHASKVFRAHPELPSQKAAFWIDHVINVGTQYYRHIAHDVPWYVLYSMDVLLCLVVILGIIIYVTKKIILWVYGKCKKHKEKIH